MPWRGVAPVQLVIVAVAGILWTSLVGIIVLAILRVPIPDALGTLCIASMTALAGLLAPNTGLVAPRTARRAHEAGEAAAAAVVAADRRTTQERHEWEAGHEHNGHMPNGGPP